MIRARLGAFKGQPRLEFDRLTDREKKMLDDIAQAGFIRYETLHDKDISFIALRLRRRGWLEMDKGKRFMLTEKAEDVVFG